MKHIHVIPVDPSLTAEKAWHELCLMGVRATDTGEPTWATVECDGEECSGVAASQSTERAGNPPVARGFIASYPPE